MAEGKDVVLEKRLARLKLPPGIKGSLLRAQVDEGLGRLSETVIEFTSPDMDLDLAKLVGERLRLEIDAPKKKVRDFQGRCISAEYLGGYMGRGYFRATVRPWPWFLTQSSNCRIFQDMTAIEVIKAVFSAHGFADYRIDTRHVFAKRDYCVQYRESDFDFVSRLMEEEGIYYWFDHEPMREVMVLADDAGAHRPLQDQATLDYHPHEDSYRRRDDHVFEWRGVESVRTGKVTLESYDFAKPRSELTAIKTLPRGRHAFRNYERYEYSGRHRDSGDGEHHARVLAESYAAAAERAQGVCNARQMAAGGRFTLKKHDRRRENGEYLVVSARHQVQVDSEDVPRETLNKLLGEALDFHAGNDPDLYRCAFEAQPVRETYRSPRLTPRPEIPGVQTAAVVGKPGEEVWTDEHGRVKVQFHWDREGKRDERSSCWVRVASPWSGKSWGLVGVPRIGQEVVVQFEDGDPDRPLVTGMVYNGETKPPYALPANKTVTGLKSRSSKKGTGFNELAFEDRKDAEFVRLQSERDFTQIVKNNAEITVGVGHKSPGTFKQTIHGDKTETILEGDHAFKVAKGGETVSIAQAREVEVGADDKLTVKGGRAETIAKAMELDVGTTLTLSAATKIVLKCGASKIEMTPAGVTISAAKVDVKASASASVSADGKLGLSGGGMLKLEGGWMTQMKSSGLLMARGALTLIN